MNKRSSRGESKSGNLNRALTLPVDQLGIWASGFCMVHCLLTPIVLSLSAVSAHFLPSEERTHRVLAVSIAFVGALALVKGYHNHRRKSVPLRSRSDWLSFLAGRGTGIICHHMQPKLRSP